MAPPAASAEARSAGAKKTEPGGVPGSVGTSPLRCLSHQPSIDEDSRRRNGDAFQLVGERIQQVGRLRLGKLDPGRHLTQQRDDGGKGLAVDGLHFSDRQRLRLDRLTRAEPLLAKG